MTLSLSVTDKGDGTGVTAAVGGSAPGSTNALYYLPAPQTTNVPPVWAAAGTLTGDGSLPVALAAGYYWFQLQNTNGSVVSVPPLVYSQASLSADAVLYRCLTAIQAQLQTLTLANLAPPQIQVRYLPRAREQIDSWPLVCVAPVGQGLYPAYMTQLDRVDEPVVVAIVSAQNQGYNLNLRQSMKWREQIGRRVRNQHLPGVPEVVQVMEDPAAVFDTRAFQHLWFVSLHLFRCVTRQPRGA